MAALTFVLGGARSGKSRHAQELAERAVGRDGGGVLYVATAAAGDGEMAARIARHRASRPAGWTTVEEPLRVSAAVARAGAGTGAILVDCLTLLVSNLLLAHEAEGDEAAEAAVLAEVGALLAAARAAAAERVILVANEVGLGVVPAYPLGRAFRDAAGRVNQLVAREADEVHFLVAGLVQRLK